VGVPLGVVQDLLVGPPAGALHPGGQPIHHDRLAGCGYLGKPLAQVGQGGDEGAVGLAVPHGRQRAKQQVEAVADLGLGDADHAAGAPVRQPVQDDRPNGVQADLQRQRWVPPCPGGRVGCGWVRRSTSQASTCAAARSAGRMTGGPDLQAGVRHLADGLVPVNVRTHRAS
jgi:hypothetical protein